MMGRLTGTSAIAGVLAALVILPLVGPVGLSGRNAAGWLRSLPEGFHTPPLPQRSRILAADGSSLGTFYYENRAEVRLHQVAPILRRAILAIEDARFYDHGALDYEGTIRALARNAEAGDVREGGSGITQQYVKNVLLESAKSDAERRAAMENTTARKIRELRYAIAVEQRLSKDQILERYLNIAYFGDGAYGAEIAARHYFGKPAAKLTLQESALLAGIISYPHAYNPAAHPKAGLQRRNVVLDRMAELGWISRTEADTAKRAKLGLKIKDTPNGCVTSSAPFFCDYVQREILANPVFGKTPGERRHLLQRGGLTIRTTLDPKTQKSAQRAIERHVPWNNGEGKAASEVLIEPGTGKIKGMAVGRKMGPSEQKGKTWVNFAADEDHGSSLGMQAGSTFKVFTLAEALDEGMPIGSRLMAPENYVPSGIDNCKGKSVGDTTALGNSADGEGGRSFSLVTGTWHSVNTFFLALQKKVGLCDTVKMAEKLGMRQSTGDPLQQYASFTLGFNTVSPMRLAAAYAAFGARGKYCRPIAITKITDAYGKELGIPDADCKQAMSKGAADAVNHILRGVLTRGTAAGKGIGRPAAGKTGTVDNYSSAWFAGYTPDLASAVWVGDPRGGYAHPLRGVCLGGRCFRQVFGADIPAPIWQDSMRGALSGEAAHGFHRPPAKYFRLGSGMDRRAVPDVSGLSISAARAKLAAVGFRPVVGPSVFSKEKKGKAAYARPSGTAEIGTTVVIYVSKGEKKDKKKKKRKGDDGPPVALPARAEAGD